jgi:GNAT superfamily N-acetyltransferase
LADTQTDIEIVQVDQGMAGEYHARVPGSERVGRLTWIGHGGLEGPVRVVEHTLVPRELEGRGIARRLVEAIVEDAREKGFRIKPVCSFVAAQFQRHPEWAELRG